jgi:hypothetical protein
MAWLSGGQRWAEWDGLRSANNLLDLAIALACSLGFNAQKRRHVGPINVPQTTRRHDRRAKWPHHTDTRVLLLTAFGRERVGVVMQQFVGGF